MENNNLEIIDTNKTVDLNDLEQDLESIKLSYVDDNNQIIEPEVAKDNQQETIAEPEIATPIVFNDDKVENTENDNNIMPQFTFNENTTDTLYNSEPVVDSNETIMEETPQYNFNENEFVTPISSVIDDTKDNIADIPTQAVDESSIVNENSIEKPVIDFANISNPVSKITFDDKGNVADVKYANNELVENEPVQLDNNNNNNSDISKIAFDENGEVSFVTFANNETIDLRKNESNIAQYQLDENEVATPSVEENKENDIDVVSTTLVSAGDTEYANENLDEERIINDEINAQRAIINEKIMDSYDVLERERKIGIADISAFKGTFERQQIIDSVISNFNSTIDNELDSSNVENTDSDLSHIQV